MANITKQYFVDTINDRIAAYSNGFPTADSTDVTRSGNKLTLSNTSNASTSSLPGNDIDASDLVALVKLNTKVASRIRTVAFELTIYYVLEGNLGAPFTCTPESYNKIGRFDISAEPTIDDSYIDPVSTLFDQVQDGLDLSLSNYDTMIENMRPTVLTHSGILWGTTYNYCHCNCHDNCHASRGRR